MSGQVSMSHDDFVPPWWLRNAHAQTVYGSLLGRAPRVAYRRERWTTPDDDFIDIDFLAAPPTVEAAAPPFVLHFHGLEGSAQSPYARSLMAAAQRRGWDGAVVNFRGCSGEPNRQPRAYHAGDWPELDWIIRRLRSERPAQRILAVGVSLGGNALLRWLGERGPAAAALVDGAAAVCAPVDLHAAGAALERGFARLYTRHFLRTLKHSSLARLARFPGLFDAARLRAAGNLRDFDDAVTAPMHGFASVDDYWTRASSKPFLSNIAVPTLILNTLDDPFLPASALPTVQEVSPSVTLSHPPAGGHVGFVGGPLPLLGDIEWLPRRLLDFFDASAPRSLGAISPSG